MKKRQQPFKVTERQSWGEGVFDHERPSTTVPHHSCLTWAFLCEILTKNTVSFALKLNFIDPQFWVKN